MNLFRLSFLCIVVILSVSLTGVWGGHKCPPKVIEKIMKVPVPQPYTVIQKVPVTVIKKVKVPVEVPIKVPYTVEVPKYIPVPSKPQKPQKKHKKEYGGEKEDW